MVITDFTSYADVRAVLGVSDEELEDATIGLEVYASHLELELDDIHPTLITKYQEVKGTEQASRTTLQQKFYQLARLFAAYSVGRQLVGSLPMFGPKDISDGKATLSRFADSPYKQVADEVKAEWERLAVALGKIFAELISISDTTITKRYVAVVGVATDRVTGS
jgi:hypothetical protein